MRRLLIIVVCLAGGAGCLTPDDRRQWDEAMKDARGENMMMRTGSSPPSATRSAE
jgi:hypothetical protein